MPPTTPRVRIATHTGARGYPTAAAQAALAAQRHAIDGIRSGSGGGVPAKAHHTTHEDGGSDEIAIAQSQVIGLEAALAGKPDTGDPPTAHHATHEPGGSDALTALDASTLTTGTVPDARLSANVALENAANVFTANQEITDAAAFPALRFNETVQAAHARVFRIAGQGQRLLFQALDDPLTTQVALPLRLDRFGHAAIGADIYEKGRSVALGHWQNEAFSAANFSAASPMTWTVASGNVTANRYTLIGKTLVWSLYVSGSTLGGSVSPYVLVHIPAGAQHSVHNPMVAAYCADSGGEVRAVVGYYTNDYVSITRSAGGNWALGAFAVQFTVLLEIP